MNEEQDPVLHVASLDAMSRDALLRWVGDLLAGHNSIPGPPSAAEPAEMLAAIFVNLRGDTRLVLQHVLLDLLQEMVDDDGSPLRGSAGVEVIRALPDVVFDAQRDRARNLLLCIAKEGDRQREGVVNLHLIALQGLLDLNDGERVTDPRLRADFWTEQRVSGPDRLPYLTTVLEGLARWAPEDALAWMEEQGWDDEMAVALSYLAPTLLQLEGFEEAFEEVKWRLDPQVSAILQSFRDALRGRSQIEPFLTYNVRVQEARNHAFDAAAMPREAWDPGWEFTVHYGINDIANPS